MADKLDLIALELRLMETLHDLTGYTFDRLGAEAIKHMLETAYRMGRESAQAELLIPGAAQLLKVQS